jgi:hypothetical protein
MDIGRVIDAPCHQVWKLLIDTESWPLWGPSVTAVQCAERYIGPKSQGKLRTPVGLWLPFRISAFEEGEFWKWQVAGIAATGHRLRPITDNRCQLIFEMPWIAAPYSLVCKIAANRIAQLLTE